MCTRTTKSSVQQQLIEFVAHQVVVHMLNKNDLVVCLDAPVGEDRVGELAAVLATVRGWEHLIPLPYFTKIWPFQPIHISIPPVTI